MREITLDITPFSEKISLHRYIKEVMDFPFYYGGNLDALYDELSSITEHIKLTVIYRKHPEGKMEAYLPRLLRVLHDVGAENYNLEIYEVELNA